MRRYPNSCKRYSRTGSMLVLIAVLMPILMMVVGFSVDLANMQRVRTELRAATDLSSKAAAHAVVGNRR